MAPQHWTRHTLYGLMRIYVVVINYSQLYAAFKRVIVTFYFADTEVTESRLYQP